MIVNRVQDRFITLNQKNNKTKSNYSNTQNVTPWINNPLSDCNDCVTFGMAKSPAIASEAKKEVLEIMRIVRNNIKPEENTREVKLFTQQLTSYLVAGKTREALKHIEETHLLMQQKIKWMNIGTEWEQTLYDYITSLEAKKITKQLTVAIRKKNTDETIKILNDLNTHPSQLVKTKVLLHSFSYHKKPVSLPMYAKLKGLFTIGENPFIKVFNGLDERDKANIINYQDFLLWVNVS